ncbi:hypothetical protein [Angustibacter luteus]|uniref:DUF4328 domain-containing protein n=1 Tax=Angustibacter luteus TaxID=658456 RepID=A0ABW1J9N4_9ACTN
MEAFVAWCGFFGAWLLVAGPIYQAALELQEQDLERDRIHDVSQAVPKPPQVSVWWWLVPPVRYVLHHKQEERYRQAVLRALSAEDREAFVQFVNKATGWFLVAGGASLLALKETWELREHYEWPVAAFWVLAAVMAVLAASYTVGRIQRTERMLARSTG